MFSKTFAGLYHVDVTFLSSAVCKVAEGTVCSIYSIYELVLYYLSTCQCLIFLCILSPQFFGEGLCKKKKKQHVTFAFLWYLNQTLVLLLSGLALTSPCKWKEDRSWGSTSSYHLVLQPSISLYSRNKLCVGHGTSRVKKSRCVGFWWVFFSL